jgi:hypothetical protein
VATVDTPWVEHSGRAMKPGSGRFSGAGTMLSAAAVVGIVVGMVVGLLVAQGPTRYRAHATLAMLPGPQVAEAEVSNFWEVLSRGQATRTGAIVLGQDRWLSTAAADAGVPASELTLAAGSVPETTLIEITMDANSAEAAERALAAVLDSASAEAAAVSGPFALETVGPPEGSATELSPAQPEVLAAFGFAGLLLGLGIGLLVLGRRGRRRLGTPVDHEPVAAGPTGESTAPPTAAAAPRAEAPAPRSPDPETARPAPEPAVDAETLALRPAVRRRVPQPTPRQASANPTASVRPARRHRYDPAAPPPDAPGGSIRRPGDHGVQGPRHGPNPQASGRNGQR